MFSLLSSRVSRFCLTLNRTHPAITSEGTKSVPRNRALNNPETDEKQSEMFAI